MYFIWSSLQWRSQRTCVERRNMIQNCSLDKLIWQWYVGCPGKLTKWQDVLRPMTGEMGTEAKKSLEILIQRIWITDWICFPSAVPSPNIPRENLRSGRRRCLKETYILSWNSSTSFSSVHFPPKGKWHSLWNRSLDFDSSNCYAVFTLSEIFYTWLSKVSIYASRN